MCNCVCDSSCVTAVISDSVLYAGITDNSSKQHYKNVVQQMHTKKARQNLRIFSTVREFTTTRDNNSVERDKEDLMG
jgi:(2Fe-2S) ferredoxin